jgi:hypothetical protein
MKKLFLIITALMFLVLLIVSTSTSLMKIISQYRFTTKSFLSSDKYKYGDLYGMCYLSDFKKYSVDTCIVKLEKYNINRLANLYVIGDSYLGGFVKSDSVFRGIKNYFFLNPHNESKIINLNKNEKNILLIETVERYLTGFVDTNLVIRSLEIGKKIIIEKPKIYKMTYGRFFLLTRQTIVKVISYPIYVLLKSKEIIYNPNINQNIEFNLFDYAIFRPFKEAKANLNYKVFNRVNDKVAISPDKQYLLYKETVDVTSGLSSFFPVSNQKIDSIVVSLNYMHNYYLLKGFDEVYFAIMPNPVTILYPKLSHYNELIPRIQNHHKLKIPVVNIYDIFIKTKDQVYYKNDTHWNNNGFYLWLNLFNRTLKNCDERNIKSTLPNKGS